MLTGSYDRAIEFGQRAIMAAELAGVADGRPDPIRLGVLHDRLRWFLWESGDRWPLTRRSRRHCASSRRPAVGRPRSRAGQAAGLRLFGGDAVAARTMATETVEVAHAADAVSEEAFGLGVLGWAEALIGEVDRGIDTYRRGLEIAERLGGAEGIALGHANLAALLDRVGRSEASLAAAREGSPSPDASASPGRTAGVCSGTSRRRCSTSAAGTKPPRLPMTASSSTRSGRRPSGCTSTAPASTRTRAGSRMPPSIAVEQKR